MCNDRVHVYMCKDRVRCIHEVYTCVTIGGVRIYSVRCIQG